MTTNSGGDCLKKIFLILFCVLGMHTFADGVLDEKDLDGAWIRVADGCHALPEGQIEHLADSGGWNGMQRRMQLNIQSGKFTAISMASLKCDSNFKLVGPDLKSDFLYCGESATNRGSVTFIGSEKLILVATEFNYLDNPWGVLFRAWEYSLHNDVLAMKGPQSECDTGEYNVYFIRVPLS